MIIPFRSHPSAVLEGRFRDQNPAIVDSGVTGRLTIPDFYYERLFEFRKANLSPRTIDSDVDALNAWQVHTDNPDLYSLNWSTRQQGVESLRQLRQQLQKFVTSQLASGVSGVSINTRLRHIRSILRIAADPIEHGLIDHVPDLGRAFTGTKSAWQIRAVRKKQRPTVTAEEMVRLFHATESADDPHLWKVIILLLWTWGARTEDTFFHLDWSLVDLQKNVMQFTANKTSKLQGVPLTPLIVRALQSIGTTEGPIFGKLSKGNWTKKVGWKRGYYTTWSRDILPAGRFAVCKGPPEHKALCAKAEDVRPNLMFHHLRKTMVTELNIYSAQAGNWVAAHYMGGVSEMFYDMPTERIAKAVRDREHDRLPAEFHDYFAEVPPHETATLTS